MAVKGATGDPFPQYPLSVGPQGVSGVGATGPVGSTYIDYNTGNVLVNSGTGGWVTLGPQTGAASYTVGGTTSYTVTGSTYNQYPSGSDVIIKRDGKEDIHVAKSIEAIMERLCIIEPAFEMMEKYPALKAAYENYKMIEALVKNDQGNEDE